MDNEKLASAFDLWMDEFINDPTAFKSTTASALQHLAEKNDGKPLTYGQSCAATLNEYLKKIA